MICNKKNLQIMLNDTTEKFGHDYCLVTALLDVEL